MDKGEEKEWGEASAYLGPRNPVLQWQTGVITLVVTHTPLPMHMSGHALGAAVGTPPPPPGTPPAIMYGSTVVSTLDMTCTAEMICTVAVLITNVAGSTRVSVTGLSTSSMMSQPMLK